MASTFASQIALRHCETTQTIGALRLANNVDAELQEVCAVLDECTQRMMRLGAEDAVETLGPDPTLQRARALMEKLEVK